MRLQARGSDLLQAFDEAISDLDTLGEDSYKDSALIMQVRQRAAFMALSWAGLRISVMLCAAVAGQPHSVDFRDAGQQARVK